MTALRLLHLLYQPLRSPAFCRLLFHICVLVVPIMGYILADIGVQHLPVLPDIGE